MSIKLYNGKVEGGVSKYYQEANPTEAENNAIAQIKTGFEEKRGNFTIIALAKSPCIPQGLLLERMILCI